MTRSIASQTFSDADSALHLRVWISSYTNQPMHEPEIFECLQNTVDRIPGTTAAPHAGNMLRLGAAALPNGPRV